MNPPIPEDLKVSYEIYQKRLDHLKRDNQSSEFYYGRLCKLIERIASLTERIASLEAQLLAIKDGKGWFEDSPAGRRTHYFLNDTAELEQASLTITDLTAQHERNQETMAELTADKADYYARLEQCRQDYTQLREQHQRDQETIAELQLKLGDAAREIPEIAGPVDHRIRAIRTALSQDITRLREENAQLTWAIEQWKKDEEIWKSAERELLVKEQQMQAGAEDLREELAKLKGKNASG